MGDVHNSRGRGQGTLTVAEGATFLGGWSDYNMNGRGTFTLANGTVKKGIWKDGELAEPN